MVSGDGLDPGPADAGARGPEDGQRRLWTECVPHGRADCIRPADRIASGRYRLILDRLRELSVRPRPVRPVDGILPYVPGLRGNAAAVLRARIERIDRKRRCSAAGDRGLYPFTGAGGVCRDAVPVYRPDPPSMGTAGRRCGLYGTGLFVGVAALLPSSDANP